MDREREVREIKWKRKEGTQRNESKGKRLEGERREWME